MTYQKSEMEKMVDRFLIALFVFKALFIVYLIAN
jgi:hypothetical protein